MPSLIRGLLAACLALGAAHAASARAAGIAAAVGDLDDDGILDGVDNCPAIANADQADLDLDGLGDVCDLDVDGDGVDDVVDDCPRVADPAQADLDLDGLGDVCDLDDDDDGVPDATDNCAQLFNPGQLNRDGDPLGDACDPDDDNDGVPDAIDNCLFVPNPGQADGDHDGLGDACDPLLDSDRDGVPDPVDDCPLIPDPAQLDRDGDGIGDPCDPLLDTDGDGIADPIDDCPQVADPAQADADGDGLGDACDDGFPSGLEIAGGGCGAGDGSPLSIALVALALVRARRRRRTREPRSRHARRATITAAIAGGALALLVAAPRAHAQAEPRDFAVERFTLASTRAGILDVESARIDPDAWGVDLWLGYANDPLAVYRVTAGAMTRVGALVHDRVGGELGAHATVLPSLALAICVPIVVAQDRDLAPDLAMQLGALTGRGLGDARLGATWRLRAQARTGVDLALAAELALPTATAADYRGNDGATLFPYVAVARAEARLRVGANLGVYLRRGATLGNLTVGDELRVRVGAAYQLAPRVDLATSLSLATALTDPFGDYARNQAEVALGPTVRLTPDVELFAIGGLGLARGYGTPDWRTLGGVRFTAQVARPPRDRDGDGIVAGDACPDAAEDIDGFEDRDGCPDLDNDRDGVPDRRDRAPDEPEDQDGIADDDGAPERDADGDGLADGDDHCPLAPETVNGVADADGCPDSDRDGDNIADADDQCPDAAEDHDSVADDDGCPEDDDADGIADADDRCRADAGPAANGGCPDGDRDGDGLVDRLDSCPDEAGPVAHHGCVAAHQVAITEDALELHDAVHFATSAAVIERESHALLDEVAAVVVAHPDLRLAIEGHTDERGDPASNQALSQRRAEAVVAYLIAHGVDAARLQAIGFGETRPVATGTTARAHARNRRVEFRIVR